MGVGSVASMNSMSNVQMVRARSTDVKSKKIQDEIAGKEQQMRKLSSKEELSADEKTNERKKQQKEISDLNTELKRHQEELLRSQKRELMMAQLQDHEKPAEETKSADQVQIKETDKNSIAEKETKTSPDSSAPQADDRENVIFKSDDGTVILKGERDQEQKQTDKIKEDSVAEKEKSNAEDETDTGLSQKKVHAMISSDASAQQKSLRGAAITRIRGGIAVLKGEIEQDKRHGIDTDKKQKELEKLEKQEEQARTFPFSASDEKNSSDHTMKPAANVRVSGIQNKTEDNTVINLSNTSKENDQALQRQLQVSFG